MNFLKRLTSRWSSGEEARAVRRAQEEELERGGEERFDKEDFENAKGDIHTQEIYPGVGDEP